MVTVINSRMFIPVLFRLVTKVYAFEKHINQHNYTPPYHAVCNNELPRRALVAYCWTQHRWRNELLLCVTIVFKLRIANLTKDVITLYIGERVYDVREVWERLTHLLATVSLKVIVHNAARYKCQLGAAAGVKTRLQQLDTADRQLLRLQQLVTQQLQYIIHKRIDGSLKQHAYTQ